MVTKGRNATATVAAAAAAIVISIIPAKPAHAAEAEAKPACGTSITACGCSINSGGTYIVANNLDATQGLTKQGDCIDIAAPFVQLNVNSFTITGNRKGAGIRVLGAAHHAIIEGATKGASDNGQQGVITAWDIGVIVGANNTIVELFNPIGGTDASPQGNITAGVEVNGVTDCTVDDIVSAFNGSGALVTNSARVRMFDFSAIHNDNSGVQVQSTNNGTFSNVTLNNNGLYGLILLNSDQNQISTFGAESNGASGISIGCEANGPVACPGNRQPGARNKISVGGARTNSRAGIVVNAKSSNNQITVTTATGNKGTADLVDGNTNCDKNQWFNNSFGTASPSGCIH